MQQIIVTEDPLHHPLHQLDMILHIVLNLLPSISLLPQSVLENLILPQNGIFQSIFFPSRRKLKEILYLCNCYIDLLGPVITYQFSDNNFKGSISRQFLFILLLSQREQLLVFFHDRTAEVLSSISSILTPTLLKLLCNLRLFYYSTYMCPTGV